MKKIILVIALATLLAALLQSDECAASERQEIMQILYIGPYFVTFNDSLSTTITTDLASGYCRDMKSRYHLYSAFPSVAALTNPNYHSYIRIDISEAESRYESCLMNKSEIYMAPGVQGISPLNVHVLEQHDRLIDGHKGVTMKVQSWPNYCEYYCGYTTRMLNITQHCIFWMQVPTSCSGSVVQARVDIEACNYTEKEFDRVLDTFSIERLVSKEGQG